MKHYIRMYIYIYVYIHIYIYMRVFFPKIVFYSTVPTLRQIEHNETE
jgi:hypothetical protein